LDSGYPKHVIGDSGSFIKLEKQKGGSVSFGENSKGRIVGQGTMKIGSLIINNFSLVKGLYYNFLSVSQLCDIGFRINIQENICSRINHIFSRSFIGQRHGNIYLLDINIESSQCPISIQDEANLWHRKLGHISMKQIAKLSSKKLFCIFPRVVYQKTELCTACILGK